MSRKLVTCLILLTVLPLAIVTWLGVSRLNNQQKLYQQQYRDLIHAKLTNHAESINSTVDEAQRYLINRINCILITSDSLHGLPFHEPLIRQPFFIDGTGILLYPDSAGTLNAEERSFLNRTGLLLHNESLFESATGKKLSATKERRRSFKRSLLRRDPEKDPDFGWIPWYWEEGLHVLFWQRCDNGSIIGAEIEFVTLVSRIVAALPEEATEQGWYRLHNSDGKIIYQWGNADTSDISDTSIAAIRLSTPLKAWTLSFVPFHRPVLDALIDSQVVVSILVFITLVIVVVSAALYFYRDSSRHFREARLRVNFVNQVSHELKTPLTNIRLYAEMLNDAIDEEDPRLSSRLEIILSESQRLTRMITNILTFSKKGRSTLTLHKTGVIIDEVVTGVLDQFRLSLKKRNITTVDCSLHTPETVLADGDAIGQIVANLLSNSEKYAARGGYIGIYTSQTATETIIRISDNGPGIPRGHRTKIFEPYHRISNSLSEGVSGAGIGLSISRELAQMHGGDLVLLESDKGAVFECRLQTEIQRRKQQ
jgi:signal transduction histidine kinase